MVAAQLVVHRAGVAVPVAQAVPMEPLPILIQVPLVEEVPFLALADCKVQMLVVMAEVVDMAAVMGAVALC